MSNVTQTIDFLIKQITGIIDNVKNAEELLLATKASNTIFNTQLVNEDWLKLRENIVVLGSTMAITDQFISIVSESFLLFKNIIGETESFMDLMLIAKSLRSLSESISDVIILEDSENAPEQFKIAEESIAEIISLLSEKIKSIADNIDDPEIGYFASKILEDISITKNALNEVPLHFQTIENLNAKVDGLANELRADINTLNNSVNDNITQIAKAISDITEHKADRNNPNEVKKEQLGLTDALIGFVTEDLESSTVNNFHNTKATNKIWDKANENNQDLKSHNDDKTNPHGVTKSQVGLGSVPNYPAVDSVTDSSTSKFAVAASAKTAYDRGTSALNMANTKVNKAGDTITGELILAGAGAQLFVARQSNSTPSIDLAIGDADTGLDWVSDGKLDIKVNNGSAAQFNTTHVVAYKHLWAAKGVITNGNPLYSAKSSNSDYLYHNDSTNTWHFCSDLTGTDEEHKGKVGNSKLQAGSFYGAGSSTVFHAAATHTNADVSFNAAYINFDCSGSQVTTADRSMIGLNIDMDSSATGGDTNHQHRLFGIHTSVKTTGDSDAIYGGVFISSTDHTSGTVTTLEGIRARADFDGRGGAGYGIRGGYLVGSIAPTATTKATYIRGSWSKAAVDLTGGASTDLVIGSRSEVEVNKGIVPDAIASEHVIDINNDAKITNTYLIKAWYEGVNTTNIPGHRYGLYVRYSLKNRIDGNIELGVDGESRYRIELIPLSNKTLQIKNEFGYINIGPYNTSYAHFYTDRPKFYFDKPLNVKGEIYVGSSWNQRVFNDSYHPNADKLTTTRTITLSGDLTGNVNFNGSADVTLTATIKDDSHNHIIANIDGLQTALDGKLPNSGKAVDANLIDGIDSSRIVYGSNGSATYSIGDWNTVTKSGFYEAVSATNAPESSGWFWGLSSNHSSNNKYGLQIATGQSAGKLYARYRDSSGGGTWFRLYSTSNKPTKSDVGLSNVANYGNTSSVTDSSTSKYATAKAVSTVNSALTTHKEDKNDPHNVTKGQVGLGSVNNWSATSAITDTSTTKYATANAVKTLNDKIDGLDTEITDDLDAHIADKDNPHGVTKSQVGLGSVNNWSATSSATDTSTTKYATAKAISTVNSSLTTHKNDKSNPHGVTKSQVGLSNVPNYPAVDSVTDSSTSKFAVAASAKTAYDRGTIALNMANTKVNKAGDTITGELILAGAGAQLFVARQSNSTPSIDLAIGDADTGLDWVSDGKLDIKANNILVAQINTAQVVAYKHLWATKGVITNGNPLYSAKGSNSDYLYHNDSTNTWHFCSDLPGTDEEHKGKVGNSKLQAGCFYGAGSSTVFHVTATHTNANASFNASYINLDCSGSQSTTADRSITGLYIDVDSNATGGDTNHEHRLFGIYTSVKAIGDSDIIRGGEFLAEADHTAGQVTQIIGIRSIADFNGRGGTGYDVWGGFFGGYIASTATTKTTYIRGSWSKAQIDLSGGASTDKIIGSRNEAEVNRGTVPEAIATECVIDINNDSKITNAYLIKANYEGASTTNIPGHRYGLYVRYSLKNRIDGNIELGVYGESGYRVELIPLSNKTLQIKNEFGYINIGPYNTSYAHFVTDRGKYHFDNPIYVKGEIYVGSSWNQRVFNDSYHPNADKLTTTRTITLSGDLTGNVNFNGSANVTLTATVKDDSHNHIIANIDGLQTALDGKLSSGGKAVDANLIDGIDSNRIVYGSNSSAVNGTNDWNTVTKSGFYEASSKANAPESSGWFFGISTNYSSNNKYGLQIATGQSVGKLYARYRDSSGGGTWFRLYSTSNKPTKSDVGLGSVANYGNTSSVTDSSTSKYATAKAVKTVNDALTTHISDKNDPHNVTKSQVDLGSVNNWGATSSTTDSSTTKYATAKAVKDTMDVAKAAQSIGVPVGTVLYLATNIVPVGFIKANGAMLSIVSYPELFNVIGVIYGPEYNNQFQLPDCRGKFPRGWADGSSYDNGRSIGGTQSDAIRNITGSFTGGKYDGTGAFKRGSKFGDISYHDIDHYWFSFDASRVVPTASENRPVNIALMAVIKY